MSASCARMEICTDPDSFVKKMVICGTENCSNVCDFNKDNVTPQCEACLEQKCLPNFGRECRDCIKNNPDTFDKECCIGNGGGRGNGGGGNRGNGGGGNGGNGGGGNGGNGGGGNGGGGSKVHIDKTCKNTILCDSNSPQDFQNKVYKKYKSCIDLLVAGGKSKDDAIGQCFSQDNIGCAICGDEVANKWNVDDPPSTEEGFKEIKKHCCPSKGVEQGALIGIIVGSVVGGLLLLFLLWWFFMRKGKKGSYGWGKGKK